MELPDKRSSHDGPHRTIPERSYRNPPIIEALCEIHFADSIWDDTIPGAFYEKVKNEFPKKQQQEIQEAQIVLGSGTASAGVQRLPPRMQFVSDKGNLMIQVAKNLLVVNQLRPYPHFAEWEPVVYQGFAAYGEVALPQKVDRIGLRYINRIEIPGAQIAMEDYFTIYPQLPKSLGNIHGSFLVRVEIPQAEQEHNQEHRVLITFGTAPLAKPIKEKQVFMLDLYNIATLDVLTDESELKKQIRQAHNNVVMAFEDSITDQLRVLLETEAL